MLLLNGNAKWVLNIQTKRYQCPIFMNVCVLLNFKVVWAAIFHNAYIIILFKAVLTM